MPLKRIGLALLLSACATTAPAPAAAVKAPPTEAEALSGKLTALEQHATAVEVARDDAVWAFWLGGAPAAASADPWAGHEALLDDAALTAVRRARELKAYDDGGALNRLEELIVSERVGRAMREAEAVVANLEASLRFQFEGHEVSYRELGGILANEKNVTRRQSLWAASLPAATQLDAALARHDETEREALSALGVTREAFAALLRRTELNGALGWADRFLKATELRWKSRLSAAHAASRGDLPAMTKPSPALDAAFPKARIAERGTQLLASLGLYGLSQLTLELTDNPRKQPLPLTVSGVRMSFKPRGGWKDQQLLLAELGRALAMRHAPHASRQTVETTAALFASLAWNRAWLDEQGLTAPLAAAGAELGADAQLLTLRRAAGGAIGTAAAINRAYALDDDPARARLDVDRLFAGVDTLRASSAAFALARHLSAQVGEKWWARPDAAEVLRAFWASGALPEPVRGFAESGEALLSALGSPAHGGVGAH